MDHIVDHIRHLGIYVIPPSLSVTLIGVGGIGAITALTLAKMGVRYLSIYDDDFVERENLSTQFFRISDVGKPKVVAVREIIHSFTDETVISAYPERVGLTTKLMGSIIISAVDSIDARKEIWGALLNNPTWEYYLEARMGAEEFQLHTVSREDTGWYDSYLMAQNEDDIAPLPCTAKATIFTAAVSAGHIAVTLKNIITHTSIPRKLAHSIPGYGIFSF